MTRDEVLAAQAAHAFVRCKPSDGQPHYAYGKIGAVYKKSALLVNGKHTSEYPFNALLLDKSRNAIHGINIDSVLANREVDKFVTAAQRQDAPPVVIAATATDPLVIFDRATCCGWTGNDFHEDARRWHEYSDVQQALADRPVNFSHCSVMRRTSARSLQKMHEAANPKPLVLPAPGSAIPGAPFIKYTAKGATDMSIVAEPDKIERNKLSIQQTFKLAAALKENIALLKERRMPLADAAKLMTKKMGFEITAKNLQSVAEAAEIVWDARPPMSPLEERVERIDIALRHLAAALDDKEVLRILDGE